MNIKEHVQFLVLMIPTLLLLIAAVLSLAAPAKSAAEAPPAAVTAADPAACQEFVAVDTGIGSLTVFTAR